MAAKTKNKANFTTIRVEGAILPIDLLERIAKSEKGIEGLKEEDYHLLPGDTVKDAISQAWNRSRAAWANFQSQRAKLLSNEPGTTLTRDKWLMPLLQLLGYGRLNPTKQSFDIEGKSYPISHLWQQVPMHLVGCNVELDKRTARVPGASQASPHSLVQELLNRAEDYLWAFVSNGLKFRVLRDNVSLTRQAYVEFDLESMMQGEVYSDFVLFWLLCHQSRVETEKCEDFWLEKWSKTAQELGTRFLKELRKGVEQAISKLGSGFLGHPNNKVLRTKLQTGKLNAQDYYRQLLRLVYRLLFLFVAEDRDLLLDPAASQTVKDYYTKYYSTAKIRKLAGRRKGSKHFDLWQGLCIVMQKLGNGGCAELALPALGSFLFSNRSLPDLDGCVIDNQALLEAFRVLAYTKDNNSLRPVDYKNLRSEELGSVYESLLELHPIINTHVDVATFELQSVAGNERKTTGSYYTPDSLVQCLLDSALDPVLEEAIKDLDLQKAEEAILNLKVCDPACGSGHFLVAAAHRMAKRLASIRTGDSEPSPTETQKALRDVIGRCIYGVDINEMAVELCKVALWMEAIEPGKPLSFLEHHIQSGNSLLGTTPALMADGIPDEAFNPIEGDDKKKAAALKKQNKKEREGSQGSLLAQFEGGNELDTVDLLAKIKEIDLVDDSSISGIRRKQELYEQFILRDYKQAKVIADAWCAAFVWKKTSEAPLAVTHDIFWLLKNKPQGVPPSTLAEIEQLATQYKFFHWHLAFPSVFRMDAAIAENKQTGWSGGFDIVLGNPPWEKIQTEEQTFFQSRDSEIANAVGAKRKQYIQDLKNINASLYSDFLSYKRQIESMDIFIKNSNRYPLTGLGKMNTYATFSELTVSIVSQTGRISIIVPLGIATDDNNKDFFAKLIKDNVIASLQGFENEEFIFSDIHHAFKFAALTVVGRKIKIKETSFVFFCRQFVDLKDPLRHYTMSLSDIYDVNPNTITSPIFRTKIDADVNKNIYKNFPVIINDVTNTNPWQTSIHRMFNPTDDSALFASKQELKSKGFELVGNTFKLNDKIFLPIYEAKMIHQFDHRFGTYEGQTEAQANQGKLPELDEAQHGQIDLLPLPRYWIESPIAEKAISSHTEKNWLLVYRDITSSVVLNTAIAAIIPRTATVDPCRVIYFDNLIPATMAACFLANFNSKIFDYLARQKVSGSHLAIFILKQLPIIPMERYSEEDLFFIVPRVTELVYTSWDVADFFIEIWQTANSTLKTTIYQQWCSNQLDTQKTVSTHQQTQQNSETPHCPFIWNNGRRAKLRAELDAYYAKLYRLTRQQLHYILDPADIYGEKFPGETFRVLKDKEIKQFGEYRTKRLILEVYDAMAGAMRTEVAYQTIVSPPADPSIAHPPRETTSSPILEIRGGIFPFIHRPDVPQVDKYNTSVPLYTLKAAAGSFGESQTVEPDGWAELKTTHKLRSGMFVAQVVGHSMEPMIPDGAYCLFSSPVTGSRQGRIVLVEHHSIADEETSASYTVKRYHSIKETDEQGNWQHSEIRLEPLNPDVKPIILRDIAKDELRVVAEVVEVLS